MDHNPFLKKGAPGGRGGVEKRENVPWQYRAEAPSEFENRLGDALEQIFAKGVESLHDVVQELNRLTPDRSGKPWTEESFQAEMKRLGR
jgi:recombinase-like protein